MSHSEEPVSASELSFSWLINKAQQKDSRAFDLCVKAARSRIRFHCIRLLNGIEPEGDQAAQETLVKAWENIDTFRRAGVQDDSDLEKKRFETWLMRIATNVCLNITRTVKWKKESTGPRLSPEVLELFLLPDPGFERDTIAQGNAERLSRIIQECGKTARPPWDALDVVIFHLVYEQGIETVQEVAEIVGRHRDTVNDRLTRRIRPVLAAVRSRLIHEKDHKEAGD